MIRASTSVNHTETPSPSHRPCPMVVRSFGIPEQHLTVADTERYAAEHNSRSKCCDKRTDMQLDGQQPIDEADQHAGDQHAGNDDRRL